MEICPSFRPDLSGNPNPEPSTSHLNSKLSDVCGIALYHAQATAVRCSAKRQLHKYHIKFVILHIIHRNGTGLCAVCVRVFVCLLANAISIITFLCVVCCWRRRKRHCSVSCCAGHSDAEFAKYARCTFDGQHKPTVDFVAAQRRGVKMLIKSQTYGRHHYWHGAERTGGSSRAASGVFTFISDVRHRKLNYTHTYAQAMRNVRAHTHTHTRALHLWHRKVAVCERPSRWSFCNCEFPSPHALGK